MRVTIHVSTPYEFLVLTRNQGEYDVLLFHGSLWIMNTLKMIQDMQTIYVLKRSFQQSVAELFSVDNLNSKSKSNLNIVMSAKSFGTSRQLYDNNK